MTTYDTSPACFRQLLNAAQALRDKTEDKSSQEWIKLINAIAISTGAIEEAEMHGGAIEEARAMYCDDDVEIDDTPLVSPTDDGGIWVAAWVYVKLGDDD